MIIRIAISFLLLLFVSPVFSQTDTAGKALDEVVITAQRFKQKELFIPYSVKSIGQQYLKDIIPRTTPEALAGVNGVFVQKTNHGGGSPFVRGLTGNQTLLLIDGIRLSNSTFRYGPNQYLNTVDAYSINRIEVAKGTGSVQYGTDALGGVIHVITSDPVFSTDKSSVHGRVAGKYMTGDMEKTARGDISYASKDFGLTGGIAYRSFGDLVGGDTTGRQSSSGYNEWSFDTKAKFALRKNMQLTLAHQFLQQSNVPVYHKLKLENFALNEFDPQTRSLSYARLNIQGFKAWMKEIELIASFQHTTEGRNSRKNASDVLRKEKDGIRTAGFSVDILSQFSKAWTANSGIELYHDKVESKREEINIQNGMVRPQRGLYPNDSKYGNYSLFSLHHIHVKKWFIDAGLRWNTFDIHISDTTLGKVKLTPQALVGNLAILYSIQQRHSVYAMFSNGYRAPNVDDMGTLGVVDFRYEIPASDLKPEKSRHAEIGYKFKTKKWSGTLAGYYMRLNNLITRIKVDGSAISGYQVYKKENVEEAYIKGVESELSFQPAKELHITGGIAYSYGKNLTTKEPLRRIPPFNGRLLGTWRHKVWYAGIEWMFAAKQERLAQGDKDDNRIPKGGTPGWHLLNLYASYQLSVAKLNLGLQNIFNKDYRMHGSGINGYGRSAWCQLTLNF
ncbi:MAG: TonB-dependent receptor [Chitinophagaceae bacterium]|nr:TonB-dependent receptor [Chitinophagaceae bacterium]